MTRTPRALVAIAVLSAAIALGGCARFASGPAPAPSVSGAPTAPASTRPSSAAVSDSDSSLRDIQADLNAAGSATSGAGSDVSSGEAAERTGDSP